MEPTLIIQIPRDIWTVGYFVSEITWVFNHQLRMVRFSICFAFHALQEMCIISSSWIINNILNVLGGEGGVRFVREGVAEQGTDSIS